jgi:hypothetical protein
MSKVETAYLFREAAGGHAEAQVHLVGARPFTGKEAFAGGRQWLLLPPSAQDLAGARFPGRVVALL